jgi:2-keto-4-pentenoate hydratase
LEPVIGYLTSETVLEPGGAFDARGTKDLRVDAELAVEVGVDGLPTRYGGAFDARATKELRVDAELAVEVGDGYARYGAALELVDVARPPYDFESIVAENIWHRGVVFGPLRSDPPASELEAVVRINGGCPESARTRESSAETIRIVAGLLAEIGERLELGDRIICGSLVHVRVAPGDAVAVDLGALGRVEVAIS